MKRFVAVIFGMLLIFMLGTTVFAAEVNILEKDVSLPHSNIRVSGVMPSVSGLASESFQDDVNARIADVYSEFESAAVDADAILIDFSFEHITDGDNNFIVIYKAMTAANEVRQVSVVSFDAEVGRFLTIEDFLGPNAKRLAHGHISAHMRQNPGRFNSEFAGLSEFPSFIAVDGEIEFLFNQAEIAPTRFGVVRIAMNTENVRSVSFSQDEYITVTDFMVKMIPLRQAAEGLGYTVEWNEADRSIRVINGGFEARIELERNIFSGGTRIEPIELEAAPMLLDGVTHIPVSFFEEILGASHSADEIRTVTISMYRR